MSTSEQRVGSWVAALGSRQPTPGGGGAAAIAGAIGAALGAMAARYTTGRKWADRAELATTLVANLDQAATQLLAAADEDAAAYAALQASWKDDALSTADKRAVEDRARTVPLTILRCCAEQAEALASFLEPCNPRIVSDAKAGIHLLAGAARAAWQTLLVNDPDEAVLEEATARLATLSACEAACG